MTRDPRELFADEVLAVVRARPDVAEARWQPDELAIRVVRAGDRESFLYLHNAFVETRDMSPDERARGIERLVAAVLDRPDVPAEWEVARDQLVAVLRPATFFRLGDGEGAPVWRRFAPCLVEAIAIDFPASMTYATADNLRAWGVSPGAAFAAAHALLDEVGLAGVEPYDPGADSPIWSVDSDDAYESSRLVVPGWLAGFAGRVHGRPVAAAPHRSMLLVTGDARVEAVDRLLDTALAEYLASPRSISPALYTVDDAGRVVPYRVAREHPLAIKVGRAERILAAEEYGRQAGQLEERLAGAGEDVHVARYTLIEREDGRHVSYCVWGEGVDALLPRTDLVALAGGDGDAGWHFFVRWGDLRDVVGDAWRPERGVEPERVRLRAWPDRGALAQLRAREVELDAL